MQTPQPQPQASPPRKVSAQDFSNLGADPSPRAKILLAAMKIIYSNPKGFVDMISQASDPKQGIAMATKIIFDQIAKSVKGVPAQQIQQLYPIAVKKLTPAIVYLLVELAMAAGVKGLEGSAPGAPPDAAAAPQQPGLVAQAQNQPQPAEA